MLSILQYIYICKFLEQSLVMYKVEPDNNMIPFHLKPKKFTHNRLLFVHFKVKWKEFTVYNFFSTHYIFVGEIVFHRTKK